MAPIILCSASDMKIKKQFKGLSSYRYSDNPLEREFAKAWQFANDTSYPLLDYLMDEENKGKPNPPLTEREWKVANTLIQWLGSPVGQGFLRDVLVTKAARNFFGTIKTLKAEKNNE